MIATMQLKISLEKAQQLKERLDELRATAREQQRNLKQKLKCAKTETEHDELHSAIEHAEELEADLNFTNLIRAMIDYGLEKMLNAPDGTLLNLLHECKATRGRPRINGVAK